MSTGIQYTEKKGSYVITFDDKYKQKVFDGIIHDIADYHVSGDVYNITHSKLIDLIHRYAVSRPLSSSILMSKKQFILSYIYEHLPESFAYREMITDMASALNDVKDLNIINVGNVVSNINPELKEFLIPLQPHLYGTCHHISSTYLCRQFYSTVPLNNMSSTMTYTSINMGLKRLIDDCVKYLKSDYDSILVDNGISMKYR